MSKNIAIVTGASSGMGREFVRELDKEGLDEIWAIGLGKEDLDNIVKESKTKVIPFNLDLTEEESFVAIRNMLDSDKPNVTWLCVCAGYGKFGRWDEICINETTKMIDLNCKAYVQTTQYVLPYMTSGARIVEIASVAAFMPIPYINVYAATKAFALSYCRGLNQELKSSGISVTCICPYWTKTKFFDTALKTKAKREVVSKYEVMYDPIEVVAKAMKDAHKRKEISVYGSRARFNRFMLKVTPHKLAMKIWIKQQHLKDKY